MRKAIGLRLFVLSSLAFKAIDKVVRISKNV